MTFLYPVTPPVKLYTDLDGNPLDGGYIYFGTANQNPETVPVQMYWDAAGTIPAAQPIRTVSGYISRQGTPANIYATGDFSITIRNSNGVLIATSPTSTDIQLALAIAGASSAAAIPIADAGTHYTTDNVEAALQQIGDAGFVTLARLAAEVTAKLIPTGTVMDYALKDSAITDAPTGWVFASGRTIGSASSNATERKNADTVNLYTLLWNNYTNTELPIQDSAGTPTTRGVSAANDFAANKRLPVPDCRGRIRVGLDYNNGVALADRITAAGGNFDSAVLGKAQDRQNHTLTEAQLPAHKHTLTDPTHNHTQDAHTHIQAAHHHTVANTVLTTNGGITLSGGGASVVDIDRTTIDSGDATATNNNATATNQAASTGITMANTGSGNAHPIVPPVITFNAIIKL